MMSVTHTAKYSQCEVINSHTFYDIPTIIDPLPNLAVACTYAEVELVA